MQSKLQLTWNQVPRNNPIRHLPDEASPLLVANNKDEPSELRRQFNDFFAAWKAKDLPGENCHDVIDSFLNAGSPLCSTILEGMRVRQWTRLSVNLR